MPVLTYTSLEEAAFYLPAAKHYRLIVGTDAARNAAKVLGVHAKVLDEHPLAPSVGLEIDANYGRAEWSLWSGDECVWSPGA